MILSGGTRQGAESYAERRFREGMESWRRKARPLLIAFFGLPCLFALVWGILARQPMGLACGLVAGACVGAWITLRDSTPGYLENWRKGAEGERRTRRELLKLGWHFVEDVPDSRGNFDHIVVGPAGIFHLETKYPSGIAEVADGSLRVRGRHGEHRPTALDVKRQLLGGSAALCREIEKQCGRRHWVNGVVVLWSPFPQRIVEVGPITYVHGKELRAWLKGHKPSMDVSRVDLLEGVLNAIKRQRDEQQAAVVEPAVGSKLPRSAEAG
jgi:hypothetical protein